jgi:hypothetical protein
MSTARVSAGSSAERRESQRVTRALAETATSKWTVYGEHPLRVLRGAARGGVLVRRGPPAPRSTGETLSRLLRAGLLLSAVGDVFMEMHDNGQKQHFVSGLGAHGGTSHGSRGPTVYCRCLAQRSHLPRGAHLLLPRFPRSELWVRPQRCTRAAREGSLGALRSFSFVKAAVFAGLATGLTVYLWPGPCPRPREEREGCSVGEGVVVVGQGAAALLLLGTECSQPLTS